MKKRYTCPFCAERKGSVGKSVHLKNLNVTYDKGFYYCFRCQAKGRITEKLLEEIEEHNEHLVNYVRNFSYELPIREVEEDPVTEIDYDELNDINKNAKLLSYDRDNIYSSYLKSRKLSKFAFQYMKPRAYLRGTYDKFLYRVLFPLEIDGNIYGYSGKTLNESNKIPYMHTKGIPRKYYLYNEDVLSRDIPFVYICEGVFDVVGIGFNIAVATFGKAITDLQLSKLIQSNIPELIFCLDSDAWIDSYSYALELSLYDKNKRISCIKIPAGEDPNTINVHTLKKERLL